MASLLTTASLIAFYARLSSQENCSSQLPSGYGGDVSTLYAISTDCYIRTRNLTNNRHHVRNALSHECGRDFINTVSHDEGKPIMLAMWKTDDPYYNWTGTVLYKNHYDHKMVGNFGLAAVDEFDSCHITDFWKGLNMTCYRLNDTILNIYEYQERVDNSTGQHDFFELILLDSRSMELYVPTDIIPKVVYSFYNENASYIVLETSVTHEFLIGCEQLMSGMWSYSYTVVNTRVSRDGSKEETAPLLMYADTEYMIIALCDQTVGGCGYYIGHYELAKGYSNEQSLIQWASSDDTPIPTVGNSPPFGCVYESNPLEYVGLFRWQISPAEMEEMEINDTTTRLYKSRNPRNESFIPLTIIGVAAFLYLNIFICCIFLPRENDLQENPTEFMLSPDEQLFFDEAPRAGLAARLAKENV